MFSDKENIERLGNFQMKKGSIHAADIIGTLDTQLELARQNSNISGREVRALEELVERLRTEQDMPRVQANTTVINQSNTETAPPPVTLSDPFAGPPGFNAGIN